MTIDDQDYTIPKKFHDKKISEQFNRKVESIPIELTPVKTLTEWFANLPLIYKLDLYNSYSGVITKHLK